MGLFVYLTLYVKSKLQKYKNVHNTTDLYEQKVVNNDEQR